MPEKLRTRALSAVESIERLELPLGRWLLVLGSIVVLRHYLEQLAGQQKTMYFLSYFLHYPLAYVAPLLGLTVVLAAFARERSDRVARLMLFAWLLTLLPPLLDMLIARTREAPDLIGYLIPRSGTLWQAFVNLLNPAYAGFQGTTAGIRIEAAAGCILAALYVHLKTRSALRALAGAVAVYATMFFFFSLPSITLAVARLFGSDIDNVYQFFFAQAAVHRAFTNATPFALSDLSNALVDLFVIVPVAAVWCRMADRERLASIARLVDPVAGALCVALPLLGMVLGSRLLLGTGPLVSIMHPFDVVALAGVFAAAFLAQPATAALAALHGNEPLPEGRRRTLTADAVFLFAFSTLFALCVSYVALTYVLGFFAVSYLYHARPFQLSRFAPAAGFLAGAAALLLLELGYSCYAGASAALWFPKSLVVLTLAAPTLALTARELWAPHDSLISLAQRLGERRARVVTGALGALACLLPPFVLRAPLLALVSVPAAVAVLLTVLRARPGAMPRAFGVVALAFTAAMVVWSAGAPPALRDEVATTSFATARRVSGSFELYDERAATPAQQALGEGLDRFRARDFEGAVASFRRAIEEDPEYTDAYLSLGAAYLRLGQSQEAARAFRRSLALEPQSAKGHLGLAQSYLLQAGPDSAVVELNRAIELDPESSEASYTLALVYQETTEPEKELEALRRTVSIDPQHSLAHARLGDLQMSAGSYAEAIASFKAALVGRTPIEHLHSRLSNAYHAVGDLAAAEEEMRKEILLTPKSASPHAVLARLLAEQGRNAEARQEIETAMSLTKDERLLSLLRTELEALGR